MGEPFRDPDLPLAGRVDDLIARLTPAEKLGLLHQYQAPVERLGLKVFRTGTEALHGLAWHGHATVFPQAIGLASTWDPETVRRVGDATSDEVLAFHRKDPAGVGRNVWAPVVNPLRDARWGRNEEGYSEDPWLTGVMAAAYASGLRGSDPTTLKTAPTLKHFLAYNNETDRCVSSSNLPPRVLREYELPAYRPALENGLAVAVMPSYNLVNGRPAHLSPLINQVLRVWAPGEILVVSDAYAPGNLFGTQGYFDDPAEAYAYAIKAGLDSFTQDDDRCEVTLAHIRQALERGLLTEADIDSAARRALTMRFLLGEFDPASPYDDVTEAVINCPEHQQLAREAARSSFVLLANDGLLPLRESTKVAVIGQLADTVMEDWYSGTLPYAVSALDGLAGRCETVYCEGVDRIALTSEAGPVTADPYGGPVTIGARPGSFDLFDWGGGACALRAVASGRYLSVDADGVLVNDQAGPGGWEVRQTFRLEEWPRGMVALRHIATGRSIGLLEGDRLGLVDDEAALSLCVDVQISGAREAASAAERADVAVVVAGNHPLVNGRETEDRRELDLPRAQQEVLRAVLAANPRTVLVISSGYPVTWDADVPAVLWSAHGGQEYGHALAEVLFGEADPEGRLTQTWYGSACELPDLLDYDIIAADATYQYFRGIPLFPFGHGLSYTSFDYAGLSTAVSDSSVTAQVTLTNTGSRSGVEVAQLYTRQVRSRAKQPLRRLRGFAKVRLAPGESRTVTISFPIAELAYWDVTRGRFALEDAPHKIMVGRSATDLRLSTCVDIAGEVIPPRRGPMRAVDFDDYDAIVLVDRDRVAGDAAASQVGGAWLRFREVDLTGITRCTVEATSAEGGVLTLRLGDPLYGRTLAAFAVPQGSRYVFKQISASVAAAEGVHDVYVVFEAAGITLADVSFA